MLTTGYAVLLAGLQSPEMHVIRYSFCDHPTAACLIVLKQKMSNRHRIVLTFYFHAFLHLYMHITLLPLPAALFSHCMQFYFLQYPAPLKVTGNRPSPGLLPDCARAATVSISPYRHTLGSGQAFEGQRKLQTERRGSRMSRAIFVKARELVVAN